MKNGVKKTIKSTINSRGCELKRIYVDSDMPLDLEVLAQADGFKSSNDMFKYLDDNYDIDTPKEFWVYRWERI